MAKPEAKLALDVVFPTPPLPEVTTMIFATVGLLMKRIVKEIGRIAKGAAKRSVWDKWISVPKLERIAFITGRAGHTDRQSSTCSSAVWDRLVHAAATSENVFIPSGLNDLQEMSEALAVPRKETSFRRCVYRCTPWTPPAPTRATTGCSDGASRAPRSPQVDANVG